MIAQVFSFFSKSYQAMAEKSGEVVQSMFSQLKREHFDKLGE